MDKEGAKGAGYIAFLLAQIGAHATDKFAERISPLGLAPSHAGILRLLAQSAGLSQRELGEKLSVFPSRLVALVDELEERGLVERRTDPADRRTHALHLTNKGRAMMQSLSDIARTHGESMCAGLESDERKILGELLGRIADKQGLTPGVHPGYKRLRSRTGQ